MAPSSSVKNAADPMIGRLLADTHSLPEGKLEQVRAQCELNSKPFEYAFLLDALKDEQALCSEACRLMCETVEGRYEQTCEKVHQEAERNLRGDQPEKLRLTYQDLAGANPKIVCAHLSAYGRGNSREHHDELRARGHDVTWIGAPDSFEQRTVVPHGFEIDTIPVRGLRGKGLRALLSAPLLLLTLLLACSGHRVGPAFPLLLYYNQIVGSLMKIDVMFHLDRQSWTRQKTQLDRGLSAWQARLNRWSSNAMLASSASLFLALVVTLI